MTALCSVAILFDSQDVDAKTYTGDTVNLGSYTGFTNQSGIDITHRDNGDIAESWNLFGDPEIVDGAAFSFEGRSGYTLTFHIEFLAGYSGQHTVLLKFNGNGDTYIFPFTVNLSVNIVTDENGEIDVDPTIYYEFTVVFDAGEGEVSQPKIIKSSESNEPMLISLSGYTASREGYHFTGWANNNGEIVKSVSVPADGTVIVYAQYEPGSESTVDYVSVGVVCAICLGIIWYVTRRD